ncbi:AMP-binding protein, partial [Aeromicrobium alkaliterrae]
ALAGTGSVPAPTTAAGVGEGDVFTIGFSSGTTGAPKGCLMTHANYAAVVQASREFELDGAPAPAHRRATFIYLPLAHASARLHQLVTLALGGELVYGSGGTDEVLAQVAETRPTYVAGVPRLFESAWVRAGSDPTALRAAFGGDLAYALTGGAPIAPELLAAYRDAGIVLVEGYGLTETATALTLSAPHDVRTGSVGRALGCVELRIATSGEILARGANVFAGYLDDEASTDAAFVDGWFRTGDLGRLDDDGYLYLTGRLKNLVVTSTGKNVAPEPIENALRLACGVSDVVVVGDRRPYLVALVAAADEQHAALAEAVRRINANVSPPERIRKLVVVPTPFADQAGLVTASGKTVRPAVTEHWADLLATAYADETHPRVVDIDRPAHLRAAG